jgi:Kef-type K+ transport system membrane component KefB/nucleotide-binding universal stress UspA family protein
VWVLGGSTRRLAKRAPCCANPLKRRKLHNSASHLPDHGASGRPRGAVTGRGIALQAGTNRIRKYCCCSNNKDLELPSEAVFLAQIVVLVATGRLLGELMQRIRQPAIMGQLIAGMLLGPSVLGVLLPGLHHALFPPEPAQKAMLDALSQLGILLLLVMTGMETDLALVRNSRRAAVSVSVAGIAVPFVCGVLLGHFIPADLLPDPHKRFVTSLFLGTALSISSVKIVTLLVRELGFLRRTVGQVIVASAIIDDTLGWIILSVIFGLALDGSVDTGSVVRSVLGTVAFLAISFTFGRRIVFSLIRWANDRFVSELPVIAMILVIMGAMALATDAIGVHTVLGAFVAGILIGQSPILTRHIGEQLRGLIIALFMPVFFGSAGLSANLPALASSDLLLLTLFLILIASVGKFAGALLGGRLGGLSPAESLAVGCGMNARGSTEIIIATFGLSMGALSQNMFTAVVTMAIVTTLVMPPMLRAAFARLPVTPQEHERLEREEVEERGFIPNVERLLIAADASPSGQLASHLFGLLAGVRGTPATLLHFDPQPAQRGEDDAEAQRTASLVSEAAQTGSEAAAAANSGVDVSLQRAEPSVTESAIAEEAKKGYGLLVIGREPVSQHTQFDPQITRSASAFQGPVAIVSARGKHRDHGSYAPLNILVPITGTPVSRRGAELAVALAEGSKGRVAALHVGGASPEQHHQWSSRFGAALAPDRVANAAIRDVVELGRSYGVDVRGIARSRRAAQDVIRREIEYGGFNLLVIGVSPRPDEQLFFGEVAAALLDTARCSIVFLSTES